MEGLVSVIIPAYNAEKYIKQTIDSVIAQSYKNWEVIIINDGSTDRTTEIVKEFLVDSRINYFFQKNSGVSVSRNNGSVRAKGEFVAFLDADDAWVSDNLEKKVTLLNKLPDVDWVYSDMYNATSNLEKINIDKAGKESEVLMNLLQWKGAAIPGPCSNIVVRKKCIDNGVLFDPELSTIADRDFSIQLSSQFKGIKISEPLVIYRILPNSMSRNMTLMEKDHVRLYKKLKKSNIFDSWLIKKKSFSNMFIVLASSWWVNGHDKIRGAYWAIFSVILFPPNIWKVAMKFFRR